MLKVTPPPSEIKGIMPPISEEGLGVFLLAKSVWLVMQNYAKSYPFCFSLEPNEKLVKVIDLRRSELVPGPNNKFGTTVRWEKPWFTHSEVKHYKYKVLDSSGKRRRKRGNNLNTALQTVSRKIGVP